jgi:hypothetical protein
MEIGTVVTSIKGRFVIKNILTVIFLTQATAYASCLEAYQVHKFDVLTAPVTSAISSSGNATIGLGSSVGGALGGTTLLNPELSTAGTVYGAAFLYDGTYSLERAYFLLKNYRSRMRAFAILAEALGGGGAELEEFLVEVNTALESAPSITLEELVALLSEGDSNNEFCQKDKDPATSKGLLTWVLKKLGAITE